MNSVYLNSFEEFLKYQDSKEKMYLLLVSENCDFNHETIKNLNINCYGAIFPEIIFEKQHYKDGLIAIDIDIEPILVNNMENKIEDEKKFSSIKSMLLFVDGLSPYIDPFLVSLFESTNEECKIFGGGAGKLTLQQERVIFTPEYITQNSALIIPLSQDLDVGVSHGWEYLDGPHVATSSSKNVLEQIDYEYAFDVYKNIVEKDSGLKFSEDNFFELAKSYPLGIVSYSGEIIVRDPIASDVKSLVLVGVMPQNSVIQVLKGEKSKLIEAAKFAAINAMDTKKEKELVIMIDCISRVLFLEDSFVKEIDSVSNIIGDLPLVGALTLGEIANKSDTYIDFYNKTCVVGTL